MFTIFFLLINEINKKHGYPRDSTLKKFGSTVQATKVLARGKYSEVEEALDRYQKDYFASLDGAKRSLKPETDVKYKKRKVSSIRKALYWLVDASGKCSLNDLISQIRQLGMHGQGFYEQRNRQSSDKGTAFM